MTTNKIEPEEVRNEINKYVKAHTLDTVVNTLIGELIRKRPDDIIVYLIQYIYRSYPEEAKEAVLDINHNGFPNSYPEDKLNGAVRSRPNKRGGKELSGQAAIDDYLEAHEISRLFGDMVEVILHEKPLNISAFLVTHLCKLYPKEGKSAIKRINKKLSLEIHSAEDLNAIGAANAVIGENLHADSDSDDDADDYFDDDDSVAGGAVVKIQPQLSPTLKSSRRCSVSSESMDPAKLKEQMSKVAFIQKAPEVMQALVKAINKSTMLRRMCEPEQRKMLVKAFAGPIVMTRGDNVIVQGDVGETFYLLEDGEVDVFVEKNGVRAQVHSYKPGDAFGQLALLYNAPRAATCTVATAEAKLWALDRVSFKVIVVAAAMQKRETYKNFLSQVPILESLTEMEVLTLADSLAEESYSDGTTICTQGEEGNDFYIIKEGEAECYKSADSVAPNEAMDSVDTAGRGGEGQVLVAFLSAGHYFGEIALLMAKPRQATVKAKGTLKVLAIDRATFTRVFGNMDSILQRNLPKYLQIKTEAKL